MKLISICNFCGSPRVFRDAYVGINSGEIQTYDQTFCNDCEGECSVEEVAVVDTFDVEVDTYKFVEVEGGITQ